MASQKIERTFQGKSSQEIFERASRTIEELAGRYSLKHEPAPASLAGRVSRAGAEGRYRVEGERLTLDLEFSFLVPGAVRKKVQDEVTGRLDRLFA